MATTPLGISFEEIDGSPTFDFGTEGVTATRTMKVAWASAVDFVTEVSGVSRNAGTGVYTINPIVFPETRIAGLILQGARIEPFDGSNPDGTAVTSLSSGYNAYTNGARVVLTYKQVFPQSGGGGGTQNTDGTFVTYSADIGAEYMTTGFGAWKWATGAIVLPDNVPVGILIPTGQHILTWDKVVRPPWTVIRDIRGKVNSATFGIYEAETLLFAGAKVKQNFSSNFLLQSSTLEYAFIERAIKKPGGTIAGWQHLFNPATGLYDKIKDAKTNTNYPYQTTDFTALFVQGD